MWKSSSSVNLHLYFMNYSCLSVSLPEGGLEFKKKRKKKKQELLLAGQAFIWFSSITLEVKNKIVTTSITKHFIH